MGDRLKKSLEPNLLILFEAADNIADYHDGQWGLSRKVVDAAKAELEAIRASTAESPLAELQRLGQEFDATPSDPAGYPH